YGGMAGGAIGGSDRAAMGFDEAPADGQPQSRAGALAVTVLHAVELVEDAVEIAWGDARTLVAHRDDDIRSIATALDFDRRAGGRIPRRGVGQNHPDLPHQPEIQRKPPQGPA